MKIRSMDDIIQHASDVGPKKISVAGPAESHIFEALSAAHKKNIIEGFLVGPEKTIKPFAEKYNLLPPAFHIVECEQDRVALKAVSLVKDKSADFLMKGTVSTDKFLKAILDREKGLRQPGRLLSHVAIQEIPAYPRLLLLTDAAFNIQPTFEEKIKIIENAIKVANIIGIEAPKVACISAVEKVNPKIQSTLDADKLAKLSKKGKFHPAIVEGPFGFDNAIDPHAAEIKGIHNEVAGRADIILAPNMDTGNVLYKALTTMANSLAAAIVVGTTSPVILTSRADSGKTKMVSLALGAIDAHYSM